MGNESTHQGWRIRKSANEKYPNNPPIGVGGTECQILVDHGRETVGLAAVGEKGTIHFLGSVGAE